MLGVPPRDRVAVCAFYLVLLRAACGQGKGRKGKQPYCPKTCLCFFTAAPGFLWLFVHCVQQFTTVAHAFVQMCYSGDIVGKVPPRSPLALHPPIHEEVLAAGTRRNNLLSHTSASLPGSARLCGVLEIQAQLKLGSDLPALLQAAVLPCTKELQLQAVGCTGGGRAGKTPPPNKHRVHTSMLCSA